MSRNTPFVFILISLALIGAVTVNSTYANVPVDSWTTKASMNEPRSGLGVASVNGKIYAIGGSNASGFATSSPPQLIITNKGFVDGFVDTNEEYDPATNTWTYRAKMPTPRIGFATAVYKDKIYCIGGKTSSGGYTGANEVYDPATNMWETKTPMPIAKGWITANVIGEKIYVVGGGVYDPITDSWITKESLATYDGYASAALGSKIYIIGGRSQDGYYNLNTIYDTETDQYSSGAYPPSSVAAGVAVGITTDSSPEQVYVLGARSSFRQGEPDNFIRIYDPTNDSWTLGSSPDLSYIFNFGVAVVNDELYVIGGLTYNGLEYKPSDANQKYRPFIDGDNELPGNTPKPTSESLPTTQSPSPETKSEPFPTLFLASIALVILVGGGLLVYLKKHKR